MMLFIASISFVLISRVVIFFAVQKKGLQFKQTLPKKYSIQSAATLFMINLEHFKGKEKEKEKEKDKEKERNICRQEEN